MFTLQQTINLSCYCLSIDNYYHMRVIISIHGAYTFAKLHIAVFMENMLVFLYFATVSWLLLYFLISQPKYIFSRKRGALCVAGVAYPSDEVKCIWRNFVPERPQK